MQEEGRNTKVIMIENHGDLIDRDAFLKRMDRKIYRITVTTPDQEVVLHKDVTYAEMFSCILEEPVVVPSDKTIIMSRRDPEPNDGPRCKECEHQGFKIDRNYGEIPCCYNKHRKGQSLMGELHGKYGRPSWCPRLKEKGI